MHSAYLLRQRGWLAGWLSVTAGMVSKRLNLSSNFFNRLLASSFKLLRPLRQYQIPRGTHSSGALNSRDLGKNSTFPRISSFISETVRDRPMVTMEHLIGSHGCRIEWYNFRWPWVTPTRVSRSLYTYKSIISKTVHFGDKSTKEH